MSCWTLAVVVVAVLASLVPSGKSQCTDNPYDITTTGLTAGAPGDMDASQGIPYFPDMESVRQFSFMTTANARMYLTSKPQITPGDTYIQIDFDTATNQISIDGSSSPGPTLIGGWVDLELHVSGTPSYVTVNSRGGGQFVSYTDTNAVDIKYILVQTPTMSAVMDSDDTTMWRFCPTDLMLITPATPPTEFDDDPVTCVTPTTGTTMEYVKVDLGSAFQIKAVLINDGTTLATTEVANANVRIGTCDDTMVPTGETAEDSVDLNTLCRSTAITLAEADGEDYWILVECDALRLGQYVYVINTALDAVCEMEIWGIAATGTPTEISFAEAEYTELESVTPRNFVIERSGDITSCSYFQLQVPTGTATITDDYTYVAADLPVTPALGRFDPDEIMKTFDVTVVGETDLEPDETVVIQFEETTLAGAEVGTNSMTTLTIKDDDVCYEWQTGAYSFLENVGSATPVLTRTGYTEVASKACVSTSVNGVTTTEAATPDEDYTHFESVQIEFAENILEQNADVTILNDQCMLNSDDTNDFDEMFKVVLVTANPCDGQEVILCDGGLMETEITLTNDDAIYSFQIVDAASLTEGDGNLTVVIQREVDGGITTAALPESLPITIQTQPRPIPDPAFETAVEGDDYLEPTTQVIIEAGESTASFEIAILDDNIVEMAETFSLLLGTNLDTCAVDQAKKDKSINIDDDDCYYSLEGEDEDGDNIIQKEIGEADGTIEVTIKCERNDDVQLEHNSRYVDLLISPITGKTAVADEDFDSSGGSTVRAYFSNGFYTVDATAGTGEGTTSISIPIYNDNVVETSTDEMFEVSLVDSSGGSASGPTKAEITIIDNDVQVGFQETSVTSSESEQTLTVILERSGDLSGSDTVRLISSSQTATAGTSADNGDYMSVNQLVTCKANEATTTTQITLFDDDEVENSESFVLSLVPLSTTDLTIDPEKDELTVTITDNDCLFSLEIDEDQLIVSEDNKGSPSSVEVTVHRNGFLNQVSSIKLKTASIDTPIAGTGRDSATPNADFVELEEMIVFQADQTERKVTINILDDDRPELTELFAIELEDPECEIDGASRKIITILDDDEIVIKMGVSKLTVIENEGTVVIPLERTGSLTDQDEVSLSAAATGVDGNRAATPEADYKGGEYTATFEADSGDASLSIPLYDDDFQESLETFVVQINGIVGPDSAATVTTNSDERKTVVYVFNLQSGNIYVSESTGSYTTYVERDGSAITQESVTVYTTDGTATSPGDYTPIQPTSLTFPAGTTSQPVTFQIVDDKIEEPSKNFVIILASEDGSIIGRGVTTVHIQDEDFPISFKDEDAVVYVNEGDKFTVTVQRSRADYARPGEPAKVTVLSREAPTNTASDSTDFDSVNRAVEFSATGMQVDVTITTNDDNEPEEDELFELYLADPSPSSSHYLAYPNVITVHIRDDDGTPPGGDGDGGNPEGGDSGINLSQSTIIIIGGVVGLVTMIGVLGLLGCYAVSRMRPSAPASATAPATSRPPAYSRTPNYYTRNERPIELRRQQPTNYYNNGGYRY